MCSDCICITDLLNLSTVLQLGNNKFGGVFCTLNLEILTELTKETWISVSFIMPWGGLMDAFQVLLNLQMGSYVILPFPDLL